MHRIVRPSLLAALTLTSVAACSARQIVSAPQINTPDTAAPACTDDALSLSLQGYASGGSVNGTVTLTARGRADCSLYGYPVLSLETSAGPLDAQTTGTYGTAFGNDPGKTGTGALTTVTLAGGASAQSTFYWSTVPIAGAQPCSTLTGFTLTAPGGKALRKVPVPAELAGAKVCSIPNLSAVSATS